MEPNAHLSMASVAKWLLVAGELQIPVRTAVAEGSATKFNGQQEISVWRILRKLKETKTTIFSSNNGIGRVKWKGK